jgi:hypothetical protein
MSWKYRGSEQGQSLRLFADPTLWTDSNVGNACSDGRLAGGCGGNGANQICHMLGSR